MEPANKEKSFLNLPLPSRTINHTLKVSHLPVNFPFVLTFQYFFLILRRIKSHSCIYIYHKQLIIYFTMVEPHNHFREIFRPSVARKFPTRVLHYFMFPSCNVMFWEDNKRMCDLTALAGALPLRQLSTVNASKLFINTFLVTWVQEILTCWYHSSTVYVRGGASRIVESTIFFWAHSWHKA
jgi:hypothetical protein